jgi:hypothetical protein
MRKSQVKKFDATKFEMLQTKGKILKGGFTTAFAGGIIPPTYPWGANKNCVGCAGPG